MDMKNGTDTKNMLDIKNVANRTGQVLQESGVEKGYYIVTEKETKEFKADGGEFSLFRTLFDQNLEITTYKNQKKGSISTNRFDEEAIEEAVENCLKSAESGEADEAYDIAPNQGKQVIHQGACEPDVEKFFERAREFTEDLKEQHPKIVVEQLIFTYVKEHSVYCNSNGTEIETYEGAYQAIMLFSAHDGEAMTSYSEAGVLTDNLDKPFIELGNIEKDLKNVEAQLHTADIQGKFEGTMILTPACLSEFLGYIELNFVGVQTILGKTSVWYQKLNEKVADERITISVAPRDERIVCGEVYTKDGYVSENYDLIRDGVLKSFMISQYVANKNGLAPAKNTSEAFIIKNGETPYEEMIKNVKKGIIVGRFSGGEPSVNGDFSGIAKNSFLIEEGEIKGAVSETMINGNLADLLNNLVDISVETVEDGSSVLPYMAFDGVTISGK